MDSNNLLPHRIFGALYIEDPAEHLAAKELNAYFELRDSLNGLEADTDKSTSNVDYNQEFRRFQEEESSLWKAHGISRRRDELVPISGHLKAARWLHHLHNPSFTTLTVHNGETADASNPCIALVMNNVRNTEAVIFDHTFRREVVDPFIKYPKDILDCHEQHLAMVRQNSTAPVEVVYGRLVRRRMLQTLNMTRLKLWGSYKDCEIFLEWHQMGARRRLLRLIVFAYHPQCFLQAWGGRWALEQDRVMMVASKLSKVEVRADFYQAGWENTITLLPYATYLQNQSFVEAAKSAILALSNGNKENTGLEAQDGKDVIARVSTAVFPLFNPSHTVILSKEHSGDIANNENIFILKAHKSAWGSMIRLSHEATHLPQIVVCMCINCQEEGKVGPKQLAFAIDSQPRWTKGSPAKYVERTAECWTCQTQRRMAPVDQSIISLTSNHMARFWSENSSLAESEQIQSLQDFRGAARNHRHQKVGKNFGRGKRKYKEHSSLAVKMERDDQRPIVEVQCLTCQQFAASDNDAKWEKGTRKHVAMTSQTCLSAQCKRRARLFVPRDASIEYVSYRALQMKLYRRKNGLEG